MTCGAKAIQAHIFEADLSLVDYSRGVFGLFRLGLARDQRG